MSYRNLEWLNNPFDEYVYYFRGKNECVGKVKRQSLVDFAQKGLIQEPPMELDPSQYRIEEV